MNANTQNKKIEAITEKTLVIGINVGSETHYARAFDHRGIEYSKKPFKFSNGELVIVTRGGCTPLFFSMYYYFSSYHCPFMKNKV